MMNFTGNILLSLTLLMPCAVSYKPAEPVRSIQEYMPEITDAADEQWELMVYEGEPAGDTDEGDPAPDIQYLLFLQDFRNSINDALTPFMEFVSNFATRYLILFVLFIYWAVNKRDGLFTIASMCLTLAVNQLVKLTACVYRPWIRDARIVPAGDSITTATGYSFPSGHTATAAPQFGGIVFGFAAIAYITFKPYPMDYVNGTLLVDPQKMMNDGYGDTAFLIAFCIGRFIERRWIRFEPTGINTPGIILCAVGMVIFVLLNNNISKPLDNLLGSHWGHFARRMITILYYMAVYPLVIKLVMKRVKPVSEEETK